MCAWVQEFGRHRRLACCETSKMRGTDGRNGWCAGTRRDRGGGRVGVGSSRSELVDFRDAQLAHSMIRRKAEMPVADHEVLDLATSLFAGGLVAKQPGILRQLEEQPENLLLLRPRQADQGRGGSGGEHRLVAGGTRHVRAASPNPSSELFSRHPFPAWCGWLPGGRRRIPALVAADRQTPFCDPHPRALKAVV